MEKVRYAMKKPPDVIAWKKWIESKEGRSCSKELPTAIIYLEDRLYLAFMAGRKKKPRKK